MGTDKRARQKANREAKRAVEQAEAKVEQRSETTRRVGTWVAVAAAIVAIFVLYSIFTGGGDDENSDDTISFGGDDTDQSSVTVPAEVELATEVPDDFEPFGGTGALSGVEPAARNGAYDEAPPMTIDETATYLAVLNTDAGTMRLELFADEAPLAVNNFVNLARDGFYDGTIFHRVLPDFMAQGGDPTGSGTGGPGYEFADEVDTGRGFDSRGLLAMANVGPDTNGSQFFITFAPTEHLNGDHTIFGQLSTDEVSEATLANITLTGEGDPTVIESVLIREG